MRTVLRTARLSRGLTLRELSAELGCSHSAIFHLEKGQVTCPNPGLRFRLERFFGVPIEVLLTPEPEHGNGGPKAAAQIATTRDAANPGAVQDGASHEA